MTPPLYTDAQIREGIRNDPALYQIHRSLVATIEQLNCTPAELRALAVVAATDVEARRILNPLVRLEYPAGERPRWATEMDARHAEQRRAAAARDGGPLSEKWMAFVRRVEKFAEECAEVLPHAAGGHGHLMDESDSLVAFCTGCIDSGRMKPG